MNKSNKEHTLYMNSFILKDTAREVLTCLK